MNIKQDEAELVIPKSIIGFLQSIIIVAELFEEVSVIREKMNECYHNEIAGYLVCFLGIVLLLFANWVLASFVFTLGLAVNIHYHIQRTIHQKVLNKTKK
jgi:hypothetical protein